MAPLSSDLKLPDFTGKFLSQSITLKALLLFLKNNLKRTDVKIHSLLMKSCMCITSLHTNFPNLKYDLNFTGKGFGTFIACHGAAVPHAATKFGRWDWMLGERVIGSEKGNWETASRARNSPEHEDEAGGGDSDISQSAGAGREQVLTA